ncbi:MAG: hypothetical protein ACREXP_06080 [Steroidobacteraceae bacterium]
MSKPGRYGIEKALSWIHWRPAYRQQETAARRNIERALEKLR